MTIVNQNINDAYTMNDENMLHKHHRIVPYEYEYMQLQRSPITIFIDYLRLKHYLQAGSGSEMSKNLWLLCKSYSFSEIKQWFESKNEDEYGLSLIINNFLCNCSVIPPEYHMHADIMKKAITDSTSKMPLFYTRSLMLMPNADMFNLMRSNEFISIFRNYTRVYEELSDYLIHYVNKNDNHYELFTYEVMKVSELYLNILNRNTKNMNNPPAFKASFLQIADNCCNPRFDYNSDALMRTYDDITSGTDYSWDNLIDDLNSTVDVLNETLSLIILQEQHHSLRDLLRMIDYTTITRPQVIIILMLIDCYVSIYDSYVDIDMMRDRINALNNNHYEHDGYDIDGIIRMVLKDEK